MKHTQHTHRHRHTHTHTHTHTDMQVLFVSHLQVQCSRLHCIIIIYRPILGRTLSVDTRKIFVGSMETRVVTNTYLYIIRFLQHD